MLLATLFLLLLLLLCGRFRCWVCHFAASSLLYHVASCVAQLRRELMPLITQHLDLTVENRCLGSTSPRFHHETGQNLFGILTERGNGTMSWADNNTSLEPDELSLSVRSDEH
ncbi:hypothetical protein N656DRAFT_772246 [Canariomyces notabilis]|uniref:Secreted protein n=1 Tax=Canariomyces notabilis TaxID=2074819 RepID=A0AAN6QDZ9_9PEZI|nr:hypothetical protein N656DRAFT_772246 [Canariomyces arenarius]